VAGKFTPEVLAWRARSWGMPETSGNFLSNFWTSIKELHHSSATQSYKDLKVDVASPEIHVQSTPNFFNKLNATTQTDGPLQSNIRRLSGCNTYFFTWFDFTRTFHHATSLDTSFLHVLKKI
jgi:hypothetical protein